MYECRRGVGRNGDDGVLVGLVTLLTRFKAGKLLAEDGNIRLKSRHELWLRSENVDCVGCSGSKQRGERGRENRCG